MADFGKLISGYRIFRATTFPQRKDLMTHMIRQGVKPNALIITCADLRIPPEEIFATSVGEIFVARNIGGLVAPHSHTTASGMIAAVEYAVLNLEVENIIVLGHSPCQGIKLLLDTDFVEGSTQSAEGAKRIQLSTAMKNWLSIAMEAKDAVKKQMAKKSEEEQESACQMETILVSLRNLITYPFIAERIKQNKIKIYGWHFDVLTGELQAFNPETRFFETIG